MFSSPCVLQKRGAPIDKFRLHSPTPKSLQVPGWAQRDLCTLAAVSQVRLRCGGETALCYWSGPACRLPQYFHIFHWSNSLRDTIPRLGYAVATQVCTFLGPPLQSVSRKGMWSCSFGIVLKCSSFGHGRLTDVNRTCIYAEMRTKIPENIPRDFSLDDEFANGTPACFAVKVPA